MVCDVLGVNRSSYYAARRRAQQPDPERLRLRQHQVKLHRVSRQAAGARILSQWPKAEGESVGRFKASNLMAEAGKRHRYGTQRQEKPDIPNRLARQFAVTGPNQVRCIYLGWSWLGLSGDGARLIFAPGGRLVDPLG